MITNDPWLIFNRMRWGRPAVFSDEQLRAWGDKHFLGIGDANHETRWTKIKQRADAEGRSLAEICDEVAKQEGDPLVVLDSPEFSWPESSADRWKAAEVQKQLETWLDQPSRYVQALEELIRTADDASNEVSEHGLADRLGPNSRPYQSIFCAAVLRSIRSRRSSPEKA